MLWPNLEPFSISNACFQNTHTKKNLRVEYVKYDTVIIQQCKWHRMINRGVPAIEMSLIVSQYWYIDLLNIQMEN